MALDPVAKRSGVLARFAYGSVFPVISSAFKPITMDLFDWQNFLEKVIFEFCSGEAPVAMKM
jgi:hypothetical protein